MNKQSPIGIFDSGTGGLTVAKAVKALLPSEDMVYFGDTAHLPYGDKSATTIQSYAIKITNILLNKGCKVILIACNSASAAAYDLIEAYVGNKVLVVNVIDPVITFLKKHEVYKRVGLIGTLQTVNSKVFDQKLKMQAVDLELFTLATPLLVPMIEEGFVRNEVIANYLSHDKLKNIETLILGCTHYPLIKAEINEYYKHKIELIDSANIVAQNLVHRLKGLNLLNDQNDGYDNFLVSDYTSAFEKTAQLFFGKEIQLEKFPLWE